MSLLRQSIKMMRAVRVKQFGAPEVMKVENVPIPVPGDDQILMKVEACGVNPSDTYVRSGNYARLPPLPYTPGADAAGIVETVGKKVTDFKKGDRVYGVQIAGAYAEYAVVDAFFTNRLSHKLSASQGAALGVPCYTAYRACVTKAKIKPGETILVHGASGAVGVACVQIARAMGLTVLGTAGSPEGLQLVRNNGASQVFNHREEGYIDQIMTATGGEGPTVIIEMLSNVNLQRDLEMVQPEGRIVVIGSRGTLEINPRQMMAKESHVMGVMLTRAKPEEWREMHAYFASGAEIGWLKPEVGKEYPLDKAALAHHDIINTTGATGKLVLKM